MIDIAKFSCQKALRFTFPLLFFITINESFGQNKQIQISIDPQIQFQKIEHFGASDSWACQFVGNWTELQKNKIADLLFSQDTLTNGQPKGIGLSIWRFNIGAGSTEQGDLSGIKDIWRRAECFLDSNGNYDWNRQKGQIWFLNAAKERKVAKFLGFTNSPPVHFTVNKKAFATDGKPNLDSTQFDNFSKFLTQVITGIKAKTGILFDYVSPVNEPQWKWSDGGQEGTPFTNKHITGITKSLSAALAKAHLPTQINICEAGQIDYLYKNHNNPACGNQIAAFFQTNSPFYIGNLPNVTKAISGHSYFTTSTSDTAILKRKALQKSVQSVPNLKYWMSEYCILGDNEGEIQGNKKDLGINPALYIAKVIHHDLVYANASAWHWWTALSHYDYKDGLIYIDNSTTDGNFYTSKMLWAFGNYSRFIRPDAKRISASIQSKEDVKCLVSAYKNIDKKIVAVIINSESFPIELNLSLKKQKIKSFRTYTTSEIEDLSASKKIKKSNKITVSPNSVTSILIE
ncbi:O-glycosyl hydrolase [Arcicella aurantiaca]|uniref:O-glycosyl hydrolase n=1 Tax=Arcicella aurantiaca TaxID=591202 RepID=A0A316DY58_9BACT|nr:glycoside hydrolase [Arcicella aurantiaca]PWK22368.1 O-glycosyl hydrolase [Arcicella aurantiaca]